MGMVRKSEHIRCPYCVEQGNFREMAQKASGDWYLCSNCGHLALPSNPFFHCTCSHCVEMDAVALAAKSATRRKVAADLQKRLRNAAKILGHSDPAPASKSLEPGDHPDER